MLLPFVSLDAGFAAAPLQKAVFAFIVAIFIFPKKILRTNVWFD